MISKPDFQSAINRLFRSFSRSLPPPETMAALYAACPDWFEAHGVHSAVDRIVADDEELPRNVILAIKHRYRAPTAYKSQVFDSTSISPEDAARHRNRVRALLWLQGQEVGHALRDRLVALEGVALLQDRALDWRDERCQRRYKPLLHAMERLSNETPNAIHEQTIAVLDEAVTYLETLGGL
jgi:hypothetical protein